MALEYTQNIKIADLVLEVQPESYTHQFKKYGSFKRAIAGGIINLDVNGEKLQISIDGLTQSQVEAIKKRCALEKLIDFIDFIPIAEKTQQTRVVYEDISNEILDSELIYLYIPTYKIIIMEFVQTYSANVLSYKILAEEV